ncbi:hypothetical protein [Escherichia coli]|uniref:hypothetical protein n=1 Tax=Escherichia coli TaxID=562 RepID=UPI00388D40C5
MEYAGWISPAFRLKVNQTFIDYRAGRLQPAIPQSLPEALRLAADLAEQKQRLEQKCLWMHLKSNSPNALLPPAGF